ncbi:MAG TPA: phenylalanine--tRNA ligase subunit alpha [Bacteroidetes bacterium]|nr:phenylalanine--tRNA ligase subunit alpha [Bacteroidota bacterium]
MRITYLGRKGIIAGQFKRVPELPAEQRGLFGRELNAFKREAGDRLKAIAERLAASGGEAGEDPTLPARLPFPGSLHPLTLVEREVRKVFTRMGFTVERGPEIEDVWHNFDALNTPDWHPTRDPSDTLYLEDGRLLRTETSPVQIRVLERQQPPVRIVAPGRVYRNDKPDATHSPIFTQVEGLYVDRGVTFADLKGTVLEFYRHMFGRDVRTRFRPHFFPFTEPSAEVDVSCIFCGGSGCRICKGTGWIEMGGSGMVDPNVLQAVGVDPEVYTGWAFGLGIERVAMLLYGIDEIRLFYENDFRFLSQFGGRR